MNMIFLLLAVSFGMEFWSGIVLAPRSDSLDAADLEAIP
jgi:hypothetical protein